MGPVEKTGGLYPGVFQMLVEYFGGAELPEFVYEDFFQNGIFVFVLKRYHNEKNKAEANGNRGSIGLTDSST